MDNSKTVDTNVKLLVVERIAYGLGDYSGNLVYSSISAFLPVYYVFVIGIDSRIAASVMAVSKLFDGVPIVTSVIGGLCIAMFNLDKYYDKITADLAAGKWKDSSDN